MRKAAIFIIMLLVFMFCTINMALSDPEKATVDGGIVDGSVPEEFIESPIQRAVKIYRSVYSQKRVVLHGSQIDESAQIIHTETWGNIIELEDVGKSVLCNILLVAPQKKDLETKKMRPLVSNSELNKLWCSEGNSCPVKLSGAKHPLPEYYWNVLLSGDACKLVADEEDFYLASDFKQLMELPDNIKKEVIKVKVIMTESLDGGTQDVEKEFFWGDPEIDNAKEILYLIFSHSWAGRVDLNLVDPALLEYRKQ